ncbi:MAG: hypothetical protein PUE08_03535 [Eubacteriales bacterium]|nr:hypothetical protein [Eubacteriales bacterium]
MLNIKTLLDDFVTMVRESGELEGVKLISAYPFTARPTMLKENLVAVGISDISLNACHIGFRESAGDVKIFADIFVPLEEDSRQASKIFTKLCIALKSMNITAISAERIVASKEAGAYVMKTEFTFRDEILFGGEGGE